MEYNCQGLSEAGYAVDAALDGQAGLDYVLAVEYDVMVIDIVDGAGRSRLDSLRHLDVKYQPSESL